MSNRIVVMIAGVILTSACTENNVASLKEADEPAEVEEVEPDVPPEDTADPVLGPPWGEVSHDELDLGIVCGNRMETVTVTSRGESPLEISEVRIIGPGWVASHLPLPVSLDTDETFDIHMMSAGGLATLVIITNQEDGLPMEVSMLAQEDQAPSVHITTPTPGDTLSPGADTIFMATVVDDIDSPESLELQWASSTDGALSTEPALEDGVATLNWSGVVRSSGDHLVELAVTDSCGNEALDAVGFCQNEGYTEESIDLASWHFEGSALWDSGSGWVELTGPYTNQAGTAFQTTSTVSSEEINIDFSFFLSGGSGADGISLTALDSTRMTSFLGGTGGGIGYAGLPGWSIEIDTYYNGTHDDPTTADHLSVHLDGNVDGPLAWSALPDMEDGLWHLASISVSGSHMTVAIDGLVYIDQEVSGLSAFPAYVGFTAATGSLTNYHLIDALEVEGFVCDD